MAWDAREYYQIATHGYARDRAGEPYRDWNTFDLIAYFPMVPLAGRALSLFMPLDLALVLFSNICSIVAFGVLYTWAKAISDARTAAICVLMAATFPGAVSFSAGMTEGPFFLLVAFALLLLQRERFWWAAIVSGIATATRPTGIALAVVVPLFAWMRLAALPAPQRLAMFLALGVVSTAGIACYEAFLWRRYHSPTVFFEAEQSWERRNTERLERDARSGVERYSWKFLADRLERPQAWNRVLALGVLVVIAAGFYRPNQVPRVLFLIPLIIFLMTALPNRGLRVSSIPRYESVAAPLFLIAATWLRTPRRALLLAVVLAAQFIVQAYYAMLFPRGIWVG